jgi:hypothetical protein
MEELLKQHVAECRDGTDELSVCLAKRLPMICDTHHDSSADETDMTMMAASDASMGHAKALATCLSDHFTKETWKLVADVESDLSGLTPKITTCFNAMDKTVTSKFDKKTFVDNVTAAMWASGMPQTNDASAIMGTPSSKVFTREMANVIDDAALNTDES